MSMQVCYENRSGLDGMDRVAAMASAFVVLLPLIPLVLLNYRKSCAQLAWPIVLGCACISSFVVGVFVESCDPASCYSLCLWSFPLMRALSLWELTVMVYAAAAYKMELIAYYTATAPVLSVVIVVFANTLQNTMYVVVVPLMLLLVTRLLFNDFNFSRSDKYARSSMLFICIIAVVGILFQFESFKLSRGINILLWRLIGVLAISVVVFVFDEPSLADRQQWKDTPITVVVGRARSDSCPV